MKRGVRSAECGMEPRNTRTTRTGKYAARRRRRRENPEEKIFGKREIKDLRRNCGVQIGDCGLAERRSAGSGFAGALALPVVNEICEKREIKDLRMRVETSSPRPLLHKFVEERETHVAAMENRPGRWANWKRRSVATRDAGARGSAMGNRETVAFSRTQSEAVMDGWKPEERWRERAARRDVGHGPVLPDWQRCGCLRRDAKDCDRDGRAPQDGVAR